MNLISFGIILIGVFLNACAQLFIKKGMLLIGAIVPSLAGIMGMIPKVVTNLYVLSGLACYVLSVLVWMVVLSKVEVSLAYPFLSIGYIVTAFVGYFFLGESINIYKISGIIVICLGICLLYKS